MPDPLGSPLSRLSLQRLVGPLREEMESSTIFHSRMRKPSMASRLPGGEKISRFDSASAVVPGVPAWENTALRSLVRWLH